MTNSSKKIKFTDDNNSNKKIRCSVGLTIEPYGYRQGQRVAVLNIDKHNGEMTFKQIVLEIYKKKTNCITITLPENQDYDCNIKELIEYLQKFVNYCKIHLMHSLNKDGKAVHYDKVLNTYFEYVEGLDETDSIVLFVKEEKELESIIIEADRIRTENKFNGKIFILFMQEPSSDAYVTMLDKSVHYKTRYQKIN